MRNHLYPSKATFFTLIILVLFGISCNKNNDSQNQGCYCNSPIDTLYLEDAYQLIFKEIYTNPDHKDRNDPYFNQQDVNEVLTAFQAVYDLDIPERNEVFIEQQIHVFPFYGLRSVSLQTDTNAMEVKKLIAGELTGNQDLDNILVKYKFNEVQTSMFYPEFNWITIISDESLNLIPIIEELKAFPFFYTVAFGGGAIGDGNTITMEKYDQYMILDFSIGWGDCPAGCIYRKHWVFRVDQNCNAIFINSFMD